MSWKNKESEAYFDRLRESLRSELQQGRFERALELCDEAIAWAEARDDSHGVDLARSNRVQWWWARLLALFLFLEN